MYSYYILSISIISPLDHIDIFLYFHMYIARDVEVYTSHFDWRIGRVVHWKISLVSIACALCPCVCKANATLSREDDDEYHICRSDIKKVRFLKKWIVQMSFA